MPIDESARQRAVQMHKILQLTQEDERDTVVLLEKLDKLAAELFAHALAWDGIDDEIAQNVRLQAEQAHALHKKVEQLAVLEMDEASDIMAQIQKTLTEARGGEN